MDFLFMRHHVSISRKRFTAHIAMMILDARVCGHVPRQIAGRHKCLLAHGAHLIPDARVDFLVRLKIAERRELLAADLALERSFAGVRAHMNGQIVLLGKTTRTVRAFVRSITGMRPDVQLQLGRALERFVAFVAGRRHLRLRFRTAFFSFFGQFSFVATARFVFRKLLSGNFAGRLLSGSGIIIRIGAAVVVVDDGRDCMIVGTLVLRGD